MSGLLQRRTRFPAEQNQALRRQKRPAGCAMRGERLRGGQCCPSHHAGALQSSVAHNDERRAPRLVHPHEVMDLPERPVLMEVVSSVLRDAADFSGDAVGSGGSRRSGIG